MDVPKRSPASKQVSFGSALLHPGQRVLARDETWRVRSGHSISEKACLLELEALEGERRRTLTLCVPPDEVVPLPAEPPAFDRMGVESFSVWARLHGFLASTLVRGADLLTGARLGRVQVEAYQLAPALRLLRKPRPSLLVADDVGLGKTIEAGLAMLELIARRRAERVLIVAPPGLLLQWQGELLQKFGLEFRLIENAAGFAREQTALPAGVWHARLPRGRDPRTRSGAGLLRCYRWAAPGPRPGRERHSLDAVRSRGLILPPSTLILGSKAVTSTLARRGGRSPPGLRGSAGKIFGTRVQDPSTTPPFDGPETHEQLRPFTLPFRLVNEVQELEHGVVEGAQERGSVVFPTRRGMLRQNSEGQASLQNPLVQQAGGGGLDPLAIVKLREHMLPDLHLGALDLLVMSRTRVHHIASTTSASAVTMSYSCAPSIRPMIDRNRATETHLT